MAKNYSANEVKFIRNSFKLFDDAKNNGTGEYHAMKYRVTAVAVGDTMMSKPINRVAYLGTGQSEPWTPKATYQAIMSTGNINIAIANILKEVYLEAINVDLSS